MIEVTCKVCGKVFPAERRNRMYCSTKCNNGARGVLRPAPVRPAREPVFQLCETCGVEYEVFRVGRSRFCSRKCKEKAAQQTPEFKQAALVRHYLRAYGLTVEQVDEMRARGCAICGRTEGNGRHGQLHVDHDHATGRVRGALCHSCNVSLGHFDHDPDLLRRAAAYLE